MKFRTITLALVGLCIPVFLNSCGRRPAEGDISGDSEAGTSVIDDKPSIPVEALVVKYESVEYNLPLTGIAKPHLSVDIVAEGSGKVENVYKRLGDAVTQKDTLALIDDRIPLSNYRQAQSRVLSAENNLKITQLNLQSDEELLKSGDISQLAYENSMLSMKTAEANRLSALANLSLMEKNYQDTRIMSPIRGLISRKYINLGTMVTPNTVLYRVVDLNTLKIEVGIPQAMIGRVRVGSVAKVNFSAFSQETFGGVVRFISPQADENSGSFNIEIHVKNTSDFRIRGGMTAKIDLKLTELGKQLAVPDYALVSRNGSHYVYKITDGVARLTHIETHTTFGSQVIIADGLVEGDTIVVVGMKNLGVETNVTVEAVHE